MGTKRKQLPGAERKTQLLDAGAKLAVKHGAANVTRRMVAAAAGVAEALVSHYLGSSIDAQAAYAKHARKLKLTLPSKAETAAIGLKMRKHKPGDKRDTRKRTAREVKAIKDDSGKTRVTARGLTKPITTMPRERKPAPVPAETKPVTKRERKPAAPPAAPVTGPAEHKTAARAPKAAPPSLQP